MKKIFFLILITTATINTYSQHNHVIGSTKFKNPIQALEAASDKRKPLPLLDFMAEHQKSN